MLDWTRVAVALLARLERVRVRAATAAPPAADPRWTAFHHRVHVGAGASAFGTARDRVRTWRMQRAAGIVVHPQDAVPAPGLTVVLAIGAGRLRITAPCRVTEVIDEPCRAGFTYATLPGHPEQGVESFVVEIDGAGEVWFTVAARSRPAAWYARAGAPVTRLVQRRITRAYLGALASPA